jgi:hypothetical protein
VGHPALKEAIVWKQPVRRPSPALVVACLALLVALGGTGYATVLNVPRNSVGTPELKRNAVKAAKIAPNAVRTAHVLNGSLLAVDFKAGQIPQGAKGERGDKGDKGDPGATNVVVRTQNPCPAGLPTGTFCVMRPMCEAGERAVGGGAGFATNAGNEELQQSYPVEADQSAAEAGDTPVGWTSIIKNNANSVQVPTAYVVCARP